jgi:hypothetical protein
MKCHRLVTTFLALATSTLLVAHAEAGLVVTVTPHGTSGQTIWTFSGSSTYTESAPGGKFAGGALTNIEEWKGASGSGSDYVVAGAYNNYTTSLISGSIGLSVTSGGSPTTASIGGLHIDHDSSGDDFGVGLIGSDVPLSNGDIVAWSGSAVFAVDIANLNFGTFSFSNYGGSQAVSGQIYGTLPLTLKVVPEIDPASLSAVLALVVGCLSVVERRRFVVG